MSGIRLHEDLTGLFVLENQVPGLGSPEVESHGSHVHVKVLASLNICCGFVDVELL